MGQTQKDCKRENKMKTQKDKRGLINAEVALSTSFFGAVRKRRKVLKVARAPKRAKRDAGIVNAANFYCTNVKRCGRIDLMGLLCKQLQKHNGIKKCALSFIGKMGMARRRRP